MSSKFKLNILNMLSENLRSFCPELNNHFMCPTCLTGIPLNRRDQISEAHIIPKAAGGTFKTYLCDKCNSYFGRKQDKWFGEYLKIRDKQTPNVMVTDIKDGYFRIDGVKVNGEWKTSIEKGFEFIIHKNRNSPEVLKLIEEKYRNKPGKIKISFSIPILKKKRYIDVGLLTAGYLFWFANLGYSWVFQKHLNPIREQILNPEKKILKSRFIVFCKGIRWKPWIGLISISNEIMLVFGIENSLVLFQPADRLNLYEEICNDFEGKIGTDIRPISFFQKPFYGPKVGLLFNERMLVAPDMMTSSCHYEVVILFTSNNTEAKILKPCSRGKAEELEKKPDTIKFKIPNGPLIDRKKFWS